MTHPTLSSLIGRLRDTAAFIESRAMTPRIAAIMVNDIADQIGYSLLRQNIEITDVLAKNSK